MADQRPARADILSNLLRGVAQCLDREIQIGPFQPGWQTDVATAHQHRAGLRQVGQIGQKLPVPEGARVVLGQAEDLNRNALRLCRRLKRQRLIIGPVALQPELKRIRGGGTSNHAVSFSRPAT